MTPAEETDAMITWTGAGQDLRGHVENRRRRLFRRLRNAPAPVQQVQPSAATPLMETEKAKLLELMPVVKRVTGKVARQWGAMRNDLMGAAVDFAAEAVRRFDGRGEIKEFVGQRVGFRLNNLMRNENVRRGTDRPVHQQRMGHQGKRTKDGYADYEDCRDVVLAKANQERDVFADDKIVQDDPSRWLRLTELAEELRDHLGPKKLQVMRLLIDGNSVEDIAKRLGCTDRWVRQIRAAVAERIKAAAATEKLSENDILIALLSDDAIETLKAADSDC